MGIQEPCILCTQRKSPARRDRRSGHSGQPGPKTSGARKAADKRQAGLQDIQNIHTGNVEVQNHCDNIQLESVIKPDSYRLCVFRRIIQFERCILRFRPYFVTYFINSKDSTPR